MLKSNKTITNISNRKFRAGDFAFLYNQIEVTDMDVLKELNEVSDYIENHITENISLCSVIYASRRVIYSLEGM